MANNPGCSSLPALARRLRLGCLCLSLTPFLPACAPGGDHGSTLLDDTRQRTIDYRVWQPAERQGMHPLILLSHGSGGNYANHQWLIDALTTAGYSVAAPNHPGNTTRDNTDAGVISVWERPRDISLLLDHLLADPDLAAHIDRERIGAAGFSSGGYTVIALAGAIYERELMRRYCAGQDHGPDCDLAADDAAVDYTRSSLSYRDDRIRAVFAMAPAAGAAITPESLAAIHVPVRILAAQDDELVYPIYNASRYAQYIPQASLRLLLRGGHFIFLECNLITHIADWFIHELNLCGEGFDVDRKAVREQVAQDAVNFFDQNMQGTAAPGGG